MTQCEAPSGRAKRAANFQRISERAETFTQVVDRYRAEGREFPSISEIRTLVVRAGRRLSYFDDETGEEKRLNSTHVHLWDLLLSFTNLKDWVAGQPVAWPSNQLIGRMLGIDPDYVPRLLRPLEAIGACIREYTYRNRRHGAGGIDMSPTFFLLADLRAQLEAIHQDLDEYRACLDARKGYDDGVAEAENSPGQGELFSTPVYKNEDTSSQRECTTTAQSVDGVDKDDAEGGWSPPETMHIGRSAPGSASLRDICSPGEWSKDWANLSHPAVIEHLSKYSSAFRWTLKKHFGVEDPRTATHAQILELIAHLKEKRFGDLRPGLWKWAVANHGINAALALLLALERDGIHDRVKYLAGMLKKSPHDRTMNPAEGLRRTFHETADRAKREGRFN
jgi:hypothetical protein